MLGRGGGGIAHPNGIVKTCWRLFAEILRLRHKYVRHKGGCDGKGVEIMVGVDFSAGQHVERTLRKGKGMEGKARKGNTHYDSLKGYTNKGSCV